MDEFSVMTAIGIRAEKPLGSRVREVLGWRKKGEDTSSDEMVLDVRDGDMAHFFHEDGLLKVEWTDGGLGG